MALSNLPWGEMLASALGGGGAAKAADAVFGRKGREVKALGETINILADQQTRFDTRLKAAEADLTACHESHKRCEEGREEDRQLHRAEIERLEQEMKDFMAGDSSPQIATYNGRRRR